MPNFIPKQPSAEITSGDVTVNVTGNFVSLSGDEEVFGNKDFVNNVTVRGDLLVSGDTRVTQIVDFTSEDGDISGYVFRGQKGYFDEIVVGSILGAESGGEEGASSGGLDTGPVFVTNVTAVGGVREILESDFGGEIVKKVKTASDEVDVTLLAERGDAQTYKPAVQYLTSGNAGSIQDVDDADLSVNSNGYSFNATLRLDSSAPVTYLFKNGSRQTYLTIEKDVLPVVSAASFEAQSTGTLYPSSVFSAEGGSQTVTQTQVKNGDVVKVSVTATKEVSKLIILSSGALSSKTVNNPTNVDNGDGTFTVESTASVSGSANSSVSKGFLVKVEDSSGNQSATYSSDNQVVTNNSSPSASVSLTYPAGQGAIDDSGESLLLDVSPFDVDFYNLSFNSSVVALESSPSALGAASFSFMGGSASSYTSGQVSFGLFKSSNGKTGSATSPTIKFQPIGDTPALTLSKSIFRSSTGAGMSHSFNISSNQPLDAISIVSLSELSIAMGSLVKNSDTSFSFSITVPDSTPRGGFDFVFDTTKLQGESLNVTKSGQVKGFDSRVVRVFATEYVAEPIGTEVVDSSKLIASAQPVGGNAFSVPFDSSITGPKQDGVSNLDPSFGVVDQNKIVIDNQVITNASNIKDVDITVEEVI